MTPEFFEVHKDLPRQGPGLPEDVHWALDHVAAPARVLDAGCGPGADTFTLATALPEARIEAVEMHAPFAEEAAARCAGFGARVVARPGDMYAQPGPYDLIWCAGAAYFGGVTASLTAWRKALAPDGTVAFSHPVLAADASPAAQAFWAEYPEITDHAGLMRQIAEARYQAIATRPIIGAGWAAYYTPMQARIDGLLARSPSEALKQACSEAQAEIDRWRAAEAEICYLLVVSRPE